MSEIEEQVRQRYLDRMDDPTWCESDPSLDFGTAALPHFMTAFGVEGCPERRARLIRVIWQFRHEDALPALRLALGDSSPDVWKDALDGLVTIGGDTALTILAEARRSASASGDAEKASWIDEATSQVSDPLDSAEPA